jgi:hypothetical protein
VERMGTDNPRDAVTFIEIGGKPVALFEKHHFALLPWHDWRLSLPAPPRLLSLDYHADSMIAFRGYACAAAAGSRARPDWGIVAEIERQRRMSRVVENDPASVEDAVRDLHNDEHIDAALHAGILDIAFVVSHDCDEFLRSNEQIVLDLKCVPQEDLDPDMIGGPIPEIPAVAPPPFSYSIPKNRVVILEDKEFGNDDEARTRRWRDSLIESEFLAERLALIDHISTSAGIPRLFERPFILDIDLDAFNTRRAIAPVDSAVFYNLVRRAVGITIAREPECVTFYQYKGEELTAEWLEEALIAHLNAALSGTPGIAGSGHPL